MSLGAPVVRGSLVPARLTLPPVFIGALYRSKINASISAVEKPHESNLNTALFHCGRVVVVYVNNTHP